MELEKNGNKVVKNRKPLGSPDNKEFDGIK